MAILFVQRTDSRAPVSTGWRLLLMCAVVLTAGCAPRTARIYNLEVGGDPVTLSYKGGKAWIGPQRAPACTGEYRTSLAGVSGGLGAAVLTCVDGRVLNCDFEYSEVTNQGSGACVDNAQRRYRVLF